MQLFSRASGCNQRGSLMRGLKANSTGDLPAPVNYYYCVRVAAEIIFYNGYI